MHVLSVEQGPDRGRKIRLDGGRSYTVGCDPDADMVLADPRVLGKHCSLAIENGRIVLTNLTANAGTFVRDKKVEKANLAPGSSFKIGDSVLSVRTATQRAAKPQPAAPSGGGAAGGSAPKKKKVPASFANDPLVGKILGGYKLKEVVGKGGMGTVYRSTQLSLQREVAVKVLASKYAEDDAFVDQFINEARAAAQLIHPNVVQVYDAGREGSISYFSMEFMGNGAIEEVLAAQGKIPWQEAILYVLDAAHGLSYAEQKGIVHRDIKPDNLMLDDDGRVKIADLGLAKSERTHKGEDQGVIGTPHFISPEQAMNKDVDGRADIYSLGATFFRMICGRNLFSGKTAKEIVLKHIKEAPPAASSVESDVPDELDAAIARMLAKSPDDRYANAEELIKALETICAHHGIKGAVIKRGFGKRVLIPMVLLLLGAVAFAVVAANKDPETVDDPETLARLAREKKQREEAERLRLKAIEDKKKTEAQAAFFDVKSRLVDLPKIVETFDDPATAASYERRWNAMAKDFDQYAENEKYAKYEWAEQAKGEAKKIRTTLENLKKTQTQKQAAIQGQIDAVDTIRGSLLKSSETARDARKFAAAYRLLDAGATGKPKSRDPFKAVLNWAWVDPNTNDRTPMADISRIAKQLDEARKALTQEQKEVLTAASKDWAKTKEAAENEVKKGDAASYDTAITALEEAEKLYVADAPRVEAIQEHSVEAKKLAKKYRDEIQDRIARRLGEDRKLIAGFLRRHRTLHPTAQFNYVLDLRLGQALKAYQELLPKVASEEYRAYVEERIRLTEWMGYLLKRFREGVLESTTGRNGPFVGLACRVTDPVRPGAFRKGKIEKFPRNRQPKKASEIYFKPSRGRAGLIDLGTLPADVVYAGVFTIEGEPRFKEMTAELHFALGAYCFETFNFSAARKHFQAVGSDSPYSEAAAALGARAATEGAAMEDYTAALSALTEAKTADEVDQRLKVFSGFLNRHKGRAFLLEVLPLGTELKDDFHAGTATVPAPPAK